MFFKPIEKQRKGKSGRLDKNAEEKWREKEEKRKHESSNKYILKWKKETYIKNKIDTYNDRDKIKETWENGEDKNKWR